MADLSITPANVKIMSADTILQRLQVEVAVSQGQVLRLNSTTGKYNLAKADAAGTKDATHIAMLPQGIDGFIYAAPLGGSKIDVGAPLVVDTEYYLSSANGGGIIASTTDLTTGQYEKWLGKATATNILDTTPLTPTKP